MPPRTFKSVAKDSNKSFLELRACGISPHTKTHGQSAGIIFAHVASAFYTAMRQTAPGADMSDLDVALITKRSGLGPETMKPSQAKPATHNLELLQRVKHICMR